MDGEPAGEFFSRRDLPSMTDCGTHHFAGGKESAMGVLAWIALGMVAALLSGITRRRDIQEGSP